MESAWLESVSGGKVTRMWKNRLFIGGLGLSLGELARELFKDAWHSWIVDHIKDASGLREADVIAFLTGHALAISGGIAVVAFAYFLGKRDKRDAEGERELNGETKKGERVTPIILMCAGALVFFIGTGWYFWPVDRGVDLPKDKSSTPTSTQNPSSDFDEVLPGFSSYIVAQINDSNNYDRRYVFDVGTPEGARVSFYLSKSSVFTFLVKDVHGETYPIEVGLGKDGIPLGRGILLFCEVGSASNYSFMRLLVNGKDIAHRKMPFPLDLGSRAWTSLTIGANEHGQSGGSFDLLSIMNYGTTLRDHDIDSLTGSLKKLTGL